MFTLNGIHDYGVFRIQCSLLPVIISTIIEIYRDIKLLMRKWLDHLVPNEQFMRSEYFIII
jgi:hypothetical protein